jgi:hypothetical protein
MIATVTTVLCFPSLTVAGVEVAVSRLLVRGRTAVLMAVLEKPLPKPRSHPRHYKA